MKLKRLAITIPVLALILAWQAAGALSVPQSINSSAALGFCGPGFASKQQAVSYYANHPGTAVEGYVRAFRGYYHIQSDQSFASYLNNPHVKAFPAPAGYQIRTNTYCPNSHTIAPYNGKYAVGGVLMLWWCNDVRGYNCVPIAKGYCNNMVTGRMIRPVPKHVAKPVKKPKVICSVGFKAVGGDCVQQTQTAQQKCEAIGGNYNQNNGLCTIVQVVGNCSNIIVINGNGDTVSATQGGNCNNNSPPPPTTTTTTTPPPPPPPVTHSISVSAQMGANKNNLVFNFSVSGSSSNGSTISNATWSFSSGGTASGTSVQWQFPNNSTPYSYSVTVTFSDGSTKSASGSVTTGPAPQPQPGG